MIHIKLALLALVVLLQAACTKGKSNTFVYCSEASPKIFNPQLATDGATFNASSRTLYDGLVAFKLGTTEIVPALAESWFASADGLSYTFILRKGVSFHSTKYFTPTRKMNADDIVFSFNRMLNKKHEYHSVNGGTYYYFASMDMGKLIKKIEKVDSHKVKFTLTRREAPFIANLAMDFASILSKEYADALAVQNAKHLIDVQPIGTGPFVFKKYIKDNLIRYVAHKDYYRGPAKIKNLVFSITPDPSVRSQKLKAKECHFIAEPATTDIADLKKTEDVRVISKPGLNLGYLAFNTEKRPFDNPLVRRAVSMALNKSSYIDAIYQGHAVVAKNPIPPTMWSYRHSTKEAKYNPEKAKALLKQAGFAKGFSTDLWTLPVSRPYNPNGKKMGEIMQADLAKIGIKVNLVTYKWASTLR